MIHNILLHLPCGVICDLLTNWCSFKDVGRLDSSCANKTMRSRYLECVSSSMVAFRKWHVNDSNFKEYVQWLNIRAVSVTCLAVPALFLKEGRDDIVSSKNVVRLKHLCLENCVDLTDNMFEAIVKGCRHLSSVSVGSDHHPSWITDASLIHLSKTTSVLQKFRLVQSCLVSNTGIASVCASNCGLLDVDIQKCSNVGERSVIAIAKYCSSLKVLKFGDNQPVSESYLALLFRSCPNMHDITLKGISAALPDMPQAEHGTLQHMQTLAFSGVPHGTNLRLSSILARTTNLRALFLHDIMSLIDADFVALDGALEQLVCLSVASCPRLTAAGLQALLQRCPALQKVRLHACPVTPPVLENLVRHCPLVSHLSLTWSPIVNDACLTALLSQDAVPPLCELTLNGCTQVTNVSLKALVHFLPSLAVLSASYCPKITTEAVNDVLTRHPDLQIVR